MSEFQNACISADKRLTEKYASNNVDVSLAYNPNQQGVLVMMRKIIKLTLNLALSIGVVAICSETYEWDNAIAAKKKSRSKKYKKKRKKSRRSSHSHARRGHSHGGDGHDHGGHNHTSKHAHKHHSHTGFTLAAGLTLTQSMGSQSSSSEAGGASGEEDHSGHDHALTGFGLVDEHEGHDHGSEGSESSSETNSGPGYSLSLSPGYRVSDRWAVNSSFSYGKSGLVDPSVGISNTVKLNRASNFVTSLSATLPFSEASSNTGKLTSVTFKTGPSYKTGKWNMSLNAMFGYSMFSGAQQIMEEHDDHEEGAALLDEDHDDHDDHDDSNNQPIYPPSIQNTADSHDDDHDHEEDHEVEYEDRESMKFGGDVALGYRVLKGLKASGGADLALASSANGIVMYNLNVKLLQVAYTAGKWNTSGWLTFSGSQQDAIATPSSPSVGASMMYSL